MNSSNERPKHLRILALVAGLASVAVAGGLLSRSANEPDPTTNKLALILDHGNIDCVVRIAGFNPKNDIDKQIAQGSPYILQGYMLDDPVQVSAVKQELLSHQDALLVSACSDMKQYAGRLPQFLVGQPVNGAVLECTANVHDSVAGPCSVMTSFVLKAAGTGELFLVTPSAKPIEIVGPVQDLAVQVGAS